MIPLDDISNTIVSVKSFDESYLEQIHSIQKELNLQVIDINILKNELDKSNYVVFACVEQNRKFVLGYIYCSYTLDFLDILQLGVTQIFTKKGIATSLILYTLNFCKTLNIQKILLEVRTSNISAIRLYEKNLFRKIHIRKNYYTNPIEDALIYEKTL